jgi:uncharacterized membrane protein (UPF0127 family)
MKRRSGSWRVLQVFFLVLLGVGGSGPVTAQDERSAVPLSAFPREQIAIETHSARRHLFDAWRAESFAARAQGLMFVNDSDMKADQAMIFVYDPPEPVAMWMKNTRLALDMLFVDERGCVVNVHENARPGSLATISSGSPVMLVVELKGGTVAARGIRRGDRVLRPDFGWPATSQSCSGGGTPR